MGTRIDSTMALVGEDFGFFDFAQPDLAPHLRWSRPKIQPLADNEYIKICTL